MNRVSGAPPRLPLVSTNRTRISFEAADRSGQSVTVNAGYVDEHLGELIKDEDLSRYIL